ncbi:GlxA family transcriptional regulator [Micromonospora sp. HM5-17]|jgi:AraC family transcriptional activator FtrA|uniref:GlxA family transcriptional regulator n=1 Tax=Micromonospora sp. HM5-17 TaxID=2487710 RepID=UPI000F4714B9|nr:helix-turn-helix domain-containing protein [Micromonospora sp. HM5-17]ROT29449.1 helix-turn-helix domain-containing protein [Micromonospora sp. HM5-17]
MHRVVALVRPVQSTFELGCAVEVFGTRRAGLPQYYEFEVCAETPGPVATTGGYTITVSRDLSALESADTVIIPGWVPVEAPLPERVRDALLRAHARGARLVTICSGVFALARTGLLDGRSATTHPARAEQLRREFPRVRVEPDRLYVDHGDVATSAGAGAGIDLCLHLVRKDHGAAYAALLARHMVMPPHREGAQARHVPSPTAGEPLDDLVAWVDERLGTPLSVDDLAAQLGVSPRTLARRFADQLGTSPGAWLLSRRVAAARTLLEETDLPVEAIAARVGLGSAVNLRRRFRAQLGTTPGAYRQAFRVRDTPSRAATGRPRAGGTRALSLPDPPASP